MARPVRVFLSYSHEDEDLCSALRKHLAPLRRTGWIEDWSDHDVLGGEELEKTILEKLNRAELIICLVSPSFIASKFCYEKEWERGRDRQRAGEARVFPVIVRSCQWNRTPIGEYRAYPTDGKAVRSSHWKFEDDAWTDVVEGLEEVIQTLREPDSLPSSSTSAALSAEPHPRRYLESLNKRFSWLRFQGMGAKAPLQMPLDRIYTRLRVRGGGQLLEEGKGRKEELGADLRRRVGYEDCGLQEVLPDHSAAVLVGDPGSGKTTFLEFAAQKLARDLLGIEPGAVAAELGIAGEPPLPIFVQLSAFAKFLSDQPDDRLPEKSPEHLLRYLDYDLRGTLHGLPERYLRKRLAAGGCFLLLDGLDEVPLPMRPRLCALVDRVVEQLHETNRLLLTCRTAAYEKTANLRALQSFSLVDFGPEEVSAFVRAWCWALFGVEPGKPNSPAAQKAERYRASLMGELKANQAVGELTGKPLTLTMLAVLHQQGGELPEQRADLYSAMETYLLKSRQDQAAYSLVERRKALQALALTMVEDPEGRQRSYGWASAAAAVQPVVGGDLPSGREFLDEEIRLSALLRDSAPGEIEFHHLTFQAYFAAMRLAESGDWAHLAPEHLFADPWNEVILFLGACLWRRDGVRAAKKLIQKVLATGHDLPTKARAVGLAGRILRDLRPYGGDPAAGTEYAVLLRETLAIFEPPVDPEAQIVSEPLRIEVGEALGQAGDPRLEDKENLWVDLPGGRFLMGAQSSDPSADGYDKDAFPDEAPVRSVTLSPFRIGRYPVTVAQFRQFVEDKEGGYQDPKIWESEGWAWRENEEVTAPAGWPKQVRHSNRPVVGVSWYEADAYCCWRGVQLPTEAQWEFAARGEEGRKYPWGPGEPTDGHASFGRRSNHAPPVGIYPLGATPEEIVDLAGNVWEWCADWWEETREGNILTDPLGPSEGASRVVRGGSFLFVSRWLRGAYRFNYDPEYRDIDLGFRVVFVSR